MRFHLISTHQPNARASSELLRLIASLPTEGPDVVLHCLLQGVAEVPQELRRFQSERVLFSVVPRRVPLSTARNILLSQLKPAAADFVLFPDDDCWFQAKFFDYLQALIEVEQPDLLLIRNGEPPDPLADAATPRPAQLFDVLRRINSNNIIVGSILAAEVGQFDERLGLGTPLGGGEDTDYANRAFRRSSRSMFVDTALIGHRSLNGDLSTRIREMQRYWPGVMLHTLEALSPAVLPLAIYRAVAGLYLVASRRLTLERFLMPFRMALRPGAGVGGVTEERRKS